MLFYDGACGLCHWSVRFVLARDHHNAFRFAPLSGATFRAAVPAADRAALPDSMVIVPASGEMLMKSAAVLHIMRRLGGPWAALAMIGGVIPRVVLDALYDTIARNRLRFFARPTEVCPIVPHNLRGRFEA